MGLVKCDLGPISVEKKRRHNPLAIACVGLWHTRREQRPALGRVLPATRLPLKQYVCWSVQHIEKIFFFIKRTFMGHWLWGMEMLIDGSHWTGGTAVPLVKNSFRLQKIIFQLALHCYHRVADTDWSCLLAVSQILTIPSQARSRSGPWLMVGQQLQRETLK